ncbi:PIN domain [Bifidobacterium sp. DSM 109958]|uniref:PIN domain n=2 Tax=Bifidobacterium moraviense TaxID=2675323 RepID=A0A7Y0F0A6_9BIFI|nr:PIN domain [Bifidobacterium sp. DSM 109958]
MRDVADSAASTVSPVPGAEPRSPGHVDSPNPPRSVLLDTNVLLDHLMRRDGRAGHATAMLKACIRHDVTLQCASTSLKDIAYISAAALRRELSSREALSPDSLLETATMRELLHRIPWQCVEQVRALCGIVAVDRETCDRAIALRDRHDDFEDDLIVAAAQRSGSAYVVTSDRQLISHFPGYCITPSRLTALLDEDR